MIDREDIRIVSVSVSHEVMLVLLFDRVSCRKLRRLSSTLSKCHTCFAKIGFCPRILGTAPSSADESRQSGWPFYALLLGARLAVSLKKHLVQ